MSMSVFPVSNAAAQGTGAPSESQALSTTITSAVHIYYKGQKEINFEGFDAGSDPKGFAGFGSIATATYTDADSATLTVSACYNHTVGGFPAFGDALWLNITGSGVTDDDGTFSKIIIDGVTRTRTVTSATGGGSTSRWWRWNAVGSHFGGANPDNFELWIVS